MAKTMQMMVDANPCTLAIGLMMMHVSVSILLLKIKIIKHIVGSIKLVLVLVVLVLG